MVYYSSIGEIQYFQRYVIYKYKEVTRYILLGFVGEFPDLTPLDFFLWGYVKDIMFMPPQLETFVSSSYRLF